MTQSHCDFCLINCSKFERLGCDYFNGKYAKGVYCDYCMKATNHALSSNVELLKELIERTEDPVLESHLHVRILKDKLASLEREIADNKEIKQS